MKRTNIKNLTILSLAMIMGLLLVVPVMAQTTPAPRKTISSTGPNSVYIEQLGNGNIIKIDQVGGTNDVGGVAGSVTVDPAGVSTLTVVEPSQSNYGTINGSNNTLTLKQEGDGNNSQYSLRGSNNLYSSLVTGNANQTKLTLGDANTNGLRNTINEIINGSNNMTLQNVVGSDISAITDITGSLNQITSDQKANFASVTNTITGNSNIFNIQQVDTGVHTLVMATTGDYNSITTQQQGMNNTTVNISTIGSNNAITVRTSNSTVVLPVLAIPR
jgi:hypothetical protein